MEQKAHLAKLLVIASAWDFFTDAATITFQTVRDVQRWPMVQIPSYCCYILLSQCFQRLSVRVECIVMNGTSRHVGARNN